MQSNLECGVIHCSSNCDNHCCRSEIHVGGTQAHKSDDTCCSSFTNIPEGTTNNVGYKNPNESLSISCDAVNCVYNESGKCDADAISVTGTSATDTHSTECATFKLRH